MQEEATREILWNVPFPWLMYVLLVPTVAVAFWGFYRRFRLWRAGGGQPRFDRPAERFGLLLRNGVAQGRTLKRAYAGFFHLLITAGFLVLTIATTVVMLDHDFGTRLMRGSFYLWFQSLTVDLFGFLVLVGLGMAAWRRWKKKPRALVHTDEASLILILLFVITGSGFLLEGWRIAATDDPWGPWSPVGYAVALVSEPLLSQTALERGHALVWWGHLVITFAFFAWAPYTKMAHVVTGPLNIFFSNLDGHRSSLRPMDFDDDEAPLGVPDLALFDWKDRLDLDACTECGRCTAACPANRSGKALSPRDVILDLRSLMHQSSETLLAPPKEDRDPDDPLLPTIREGTALSAETLWQCTTCAACVEECPVHIEQLPKILDARRFLTMEEAEMPESVAAAMTSLEKRGHPYVGTLLSRLDWMEKAEGLEVPVLSELARTEEDSSPEEVDVVLWVGCGNALVERNHSIVQSLARLLEKAGVRYAVLGREERCTGDPARRMGNEFLFEAMAQKNIALFERHGLTRGEDGQGGKKVVTSCPHCFTSLGHDYATLGAEIDVEHHSTFLERLVEEGRLQPKAAQAGPAITFHDPCYLGRYNRVFDAPREVVKATSGGSGSGRGITEMDASRERSFCCGGGGGMSFVDEAADQRVNRVRAKQAIETGAGVVAVACPFCTTMLEDGLAAVAGAGSAGSGTAEPPKVEDIAELLFEAVREPRSRDGSDPEPR